MLDLLDAPSPDSAQTPLEAAPKPDLQVLLAGPRGFCAGVDRAIRVVEEAIRRYGAPVYVRHEIVHNRTVVENLERQGAIFVEELDEVPADAQVVFSAHGVPKSVPAEAQRRNLMYLDATCPLVSKVHREAERHYAGGGPEMRHILMIGHAGHPEVVGTMGQLPPGCVTLVQNAEEAAEVQPADPQRLAFITQTTLSVDDTAEIIDVLRARFPDIEGPKREDICYATTNRQAAVKAVAADCDLVIVIGSANSSNSQRLREVAERAGARRALLIPKAESLDWSALDGVRTLGLTAGASAPESLVQATLVRLGERYTLHIDERRVTQEDVTFRLPAPLPDPTRVAVYTEVTDDAVASFLLDYDIGTVVAFRGIAEGVENSNYALRTTAGDFILTLYEKRVDPADLPWFLGLMEHLADHGVVCPLPVRGTDGAPLRTLAARPACITTFLPGVWPRRVRADHCVRLGSALARLHLAGSGYQAERRNGLGPEAWRPLLDRAAAGADTVRPGLLAEVSAALDGVLAAWPRDLPRGHVHADLFPDNVFFLDGEVSGLIDFYFACTDVLAYDVAVCLNAWCFETDASFNVTRGRALLRGYNAVRPLSGAEEAALPVLCRGAAIRFLVTRLYDWLNTPPGALVVRKDPLAYLTRLRFHLSARDAAAYGL